MFHVTNTIVMILIKTLIQFQRAMHGIVYLFVHLSTFPVNENKAWEFNSSRILGKKTDESIEKRIIKERKGVMHPERR